MSSYRFSYDESVKESFKELLSTHPVLHQIDGDEAWSILEREGLVKEAKLPYQKISSDSSEIEASLNKCAWKLFTDPDSARIYLETYDKVYKYVHQNWNRIMVTVKNYAKKGNSSFHFSIDDNFTLLFSTKKPAIPNSILVAPKTFNFNQNPFYLGFWDAEQWAMDGMRYEHGAFEELKIYFELQGAYYLVRFLKDEDLRLFATAADLSVRKEVSRQMELRRNRKTEINAQ